MQRERVGERQAPCANAAQPTGQRVIGNSDPAKNHGTIAIGGTTPMYSSCFGMRLASVSAIAVHGDRERDARRPRTRRRPWRRNWKSAPREQRRADERDDLQRATRTTPRPGCRTTMSERGIGAASRSRWAPLSRSTITPMPANMQLIGTSSPIVPTATKLM